MPATVAESFLRALKRHGVDHVFANAGTDFAPVIEALVGLPTVAGPCRLRRVKLSGSSRR